MAVHPLSDEEYERAIDLLRVANFGFRGTDLGFFNGQLGNLWINLVNATFTALLLTPKNLLQFL